MKRLLLGVIMALLAGCVPVPDNVGSLKDPQGWSPTERQAFYSGNQGSRIMPTSWMQALKQPNGQPFLDDKLTRYGYLTNDENPISALPIGFTTDGDGKNQAIGMTCSACHTREIQIGAKKHRIDGGPAISDFENFLLDLNIAVASALAPPAFDSFAIDVLGADATKPGAKAALRASVQTWKTRFQAILTGSLPKPDMWGLGRLDAVSMIFNRLAGLDISPQGPNGIMKQNFYPADAPIRYPFLWNAAFQDFTQWPGFAPNGDSVLGLVRNTGEVYGVFADFHPIPNPQMPLKVDYGTLNSANMPGLRQMEDLIRKLAPPVFPGPIDASLKAKGEAIFGTDNDHPGQCWSCHGVKPGQFRGIVDTWATPIQNVKTDTKELSIMVRTVDTGTMKGSGLGSSVLPARAPASSVLGLAVVGGILDKTIHFATGKADANVADPADATQELTVTAPATVKDRENALSAQKVYKAMNQPNQTAAEPGYESRVMKGIWAAAPYLHNGSVPTMADLLKPVSERPVSFKVGTEYDLTNIGLAAEQPRSNAVRVTTDCANNDSGNSRCGHEFGTTLSAGDKKALLEYLKSL